ncbi:hypothetical protein ABLE93_02405 [Xanthobacter sp. KR7-65]|uniref:hypothetical protein n=1 Tax=Xanthobacter sp. KR7-65 TaxID=3156612 RepID=UPI0032B46885
MSAEDPAAPAPPDGPYRGYHDIGGRPAGPVARDEYAFADWQKLSEALRGALEAKGRLVSLDEIRRVFESFGEGLYNTLGFYERRAEALTVLLDEKGIVPRAAVLARMDAIAATECRAVDHVAKSVGPKAGDGPDGAR